MPIRNFFYTAQPGNPGPSILQQVGPTIEVEIAVPSALEQQLRQNNQPVPPPIRGQALIDTGASMSVVSNIVIGNLSVSPIGLANVGTAGGPQQQNVYPARFILPNLALGLEFDRVIGANLSGQQNIIALIGRDVLSRMVLIYNGPLGLITLSF